ncbi:MAG: GGDEF domain-containing protein [Planctomycetaceae bacterium]|nr:GGDEF domain-containing protein [Planctomycetaceae bacterium]
MALNLQDILESESLPTLPEVARRVLEIAQQPEPDMEELIAVVKADPAISARILKTANSALFGVRYRAASIESAIPLLGLNLVRMLVMGFALSAARTSRASTVKPWYQLLWKQSLFQAASAETLAHYVAGADPANWFLAGLLQDVGRLAMLSADENTYIMEVLSSLDDSKIEDLERSAFGFSHTDVSMQLCDRWMLGDEFVDAIATHHDTSDFVMAGDKGHPTLATALKTSAIVVDYFEKVVSDRSCNRQVLDQLLMLVFGIAPDEITETLADIDARATQIAAMFSVDIGSNRSLERILEDANELLFEIATQNQLRCLNIDPGSTDKSQWKDELTHVYGRSVLKAASTEYDRTIRQNLSSGVVFVDIDNFGSLNLHHGESLGDEALRRIASVVRQVIRPDDFVIRFGGDEFLIYLPNATPELVARISRRLHKRIAEIRLSCTEDILISASIGAIAVAADRKAGNLDLVTKEAQKATQKARSLGGNQCAVFLRTNGKLTPLQAAEPCIA